MPVNNIIDAACTKRFHAYRYCEPNDLKRALIIQRLSWNLIRVDMQQKKFIYFFQHLNYFGCPPTLILARDQLLNIVRTFVTPLLPKNFFTFSLKQVYLPFEERQVHDVFIDEGGETLLIYSKRDSSLQITDINFSI